MINGMGDKANAKATMIAAGVPCVPGSQGVIETFEDCKKVAKETFDSNVAIIDRIADKKIVHKNKAARHKSRLNAAIKAL